MSGAFVPDPSWPSIVELAIRLWGQPTSRTPHELRFGTNGSKSVKPREQIWQDHEPPGSGGGYLDLYRKVYGSAPPPRPNGQSGQHTTTPPRQPQARPEVAMDRKYEGPAPWDDIGTIYQYRDRAAELVIEVVRTKSGKPRFRQRKPDHTNKSGWSWKTRDLPKDVIPLYRLPEMLAARDAVVWLCEGEKDADNLGRLGAITTTNAGGAAKWYPPWSEYLRDRDVVVLPDNDPAGEHHIVKVCTALHGVVNSLRVLRLPGLGHKGDVTDWLDAGGTLMDLMRLKQDLPFWEPPAEPPPPEEPPEPPWDDGGDPPPPEDDGRGRPTPEGLPVITVAQGETERMRREAYRALLLSNEAIYRRGPKLVQPVEHPYTASNGSQTNAATLIEMTAPELRLMMSRSAIWQRHTERFGMRACNPPEDLVQILLHNRSQWPFPTVRGVLTAPTMRMDGSLITEQGYDPASRYVLVFPEGLELPEIPETPTRADALASLERLDRLLDGYPFVSAASRSVALCMLMTPVLRAAMTASPMMGVSAKAPGTGKSHLADLAAAIAIGRPCPAIGTGSKPDNEEFEKGLNSMLMGGVSLFSIDNVTREIDTPTLNMATERPMVTIRIFQKLEVAEVENAATIFMTGNNLAIVDEQGRRSVRCDLDAGVERPEQRHFAEDPIKTATRDRGRYLADVLTIARAYVVSGDRVDVTPFGSYEHWSRFVREPLVWLDQADPLDTMATTASDDPATVRLRTILDGWWESFVSQPKTLADAIRDCQPGLRDTLKEEFPSRGGIEVDTTKFGNWVRRFGGRIIIGMRFVKDETKEHGAVRWKVEKV